MRDLISASAHRPLRWARALLVTAMALLPASGCRTIEPGIPIPDRSVPWPILFVHGLGSAPTVWETDGTIGYFERRGLRYGGIVRGTRISPRNASTPGIDLFTVGFRDRFGDLDDWAAELGTAIQTVLDKTGAEKVTLVCHSAGGIAARRYLASHLTGHGVHRLVTIATPHTGTELARLASLKHAIMSRPELAPFRARMERIERASGLPLDAAVLSQLQPVERNPWLDRLNRSPHPADVFYVAIVVEHGQELSVWADLDADVRRLSENPANSTLVNRLLQRLLEAMSDSTGQLGDGVVLADRQKMSRVAWFERSGTLVREIPVYSRTHQDATARSFEIAEAVSGPPRVVSVVKRRRFLRRTDALTVDLEHEFGARIAVSARAGSSGSEKPLAVTDPELRNVHSRSVTRFRVGPFDRPPSEIDLRIAPPGLADVYVAPLLRHGATPRTRPLASSSPSVSLRLEAVQGVPSDADPLLPGRFRGADIRVALASSEGELVSSQEYPDVTTGSVTMDEPTVRPAIDPLRDRLVFFVWDVDPITNTLLGSATFEPGEWPKGRVRIPTDGPVALVLRIDWTAEPTTHLLPATAW